MALSFSGNDGDRVACGSDASLDNLATMTCLAWINTTAFLQSNNWFPKIVTKRTDGVSGNWTLGIGNNTFGGAPVLALITDRAYDTTTMVAESVDNTLVAGKWQFVGFTDGGAGVNPKLLAGDLTTLCVEPSYRAAVTAPAGALTSDAAANVLIGNRDRATPSDSMSGAIAWAGIYSADLSVAECQAIQFRTAKHLSTNVLNMHLGYNGTGTQPDWSGSGNNGTVTGATVADHVPLGPQWGFEGAVPYEVAAASGRIMSSLANAGGLAAAGGMAGQGGGLAG